jgi:hypothetical protein
MADIVYTGSSLYDKMDAIDNIRAYFISKEIPEMIERHINTFQEELDNIIDLLRGNPELYSVRRDGVFKNATKDFRTFTVHWFTVFYTYDGGMVKIWHIRSQRSDYSKLLNNC